VVTGDITQTDLPQGARSGLREARELLQGTDGISFCSFSDEDVVRHPLVQKIIVAYEKRDRENDARRALKNVAAEKLAAAAHKAADSTPPGKP
jgi:phosphate starvation-inducible PhoH-like protein